MKYLLIISLVVLRTNAFCQVENTGMTDRADTAELGKVNVRGYIDTYYGFDFNQPATSDRPYAVSSPRHNEMNINLAYIDLKYQNSKVRARFIPGVGTYVNSNYAAENGTLKNIIEANVGLKLFAHKDIWIDAGVMGSPFTNETAISKDHLMYTRSFAPEYVPYYLSGIRLTYPFSQKLNGYFYIINGWQQITDVNNPLSVATQLEWKVSNNLLINWDTYVGDEFSAKEPNYGMRYFSDVYAIYNPSTKWKFTACAYAGIQQRRDTILQKENHATWWQANIIGQYNITPNSSLAARIEYFEDTKGIVIKPITNATGFNSWSAGACLNVKVTNNALFRVEGKHFFSNRKMYIDRNLYSSNNSSLLITNITVWF
ncbi:MAG: porin [Bacteroidia bacterium]|nr:porin [Bacteroidia bacterium]